jgi:outer membrane protein assembly factor BamA
VDVTEQPDPTDASKVDVIFQITAGSQVFVRKVLLTGLHYTRPQTVTQAITIHPGDPLNQTALMDTQRNLYEFALFNEVDTAVENPNGSDTRKTVLLQTVEARRWALTYALQYARQNRHQSTRAGGHYTQQSLRPRTIGFAARHVRIARTEARSAVSDSALR